MDRCTNCGNLEILDHEEPYKTCHISYGDPCEACRNLSILNTQISAMKEALEGLIYQRHDLKSKINQLHKSMIHRMPVEIASAIFEFYVDEPRDPKTPSSGSPLTLGAVCQTWRRIAWSTPRLWASISMDLSISPNLISDRGVRFYGTQAQLVSEWIARSGFLPLSIKLYAKKGISSSSMMYLTPILDVVNKCSRRWKYLDLDLPSDVLPRFTGHSVDESDVISSTGKFGALPILEELRIHNSTTFFAENQARFSVEIGGVKPAPKTVNFSAVRVTSLDLEWNNVTSVTVGQVLLDDVFHLLQLTPQLVDCTISGFYFASEDGGNFGHLPDPNLPFVHCKVEFLYVSFNNFPQAVPAFFSRITLPALSNLQCNLNGYQLPPDTFISFLLRSGSSSNGSGSSISDNSHPHNPNLRVLALRQVKLPSGGADLIQICQATPALENLRVFPCQHTLFDAFYRALSNAPAGYNEQNSMGIVADIASVHVEEPRLLPELQTFKTFCLTFPWEVIPEFFQSFRGSGPLHYRPLHTVHIECFRHLREQLPSIDSKTLALLRELNDEGFANVIAQSRTREGSTDLIHPPIDEDDEEIGEDGEGIDEDGEETGDEEMAI